MALGWWFNIDVRLNLYGTKHIQTETEASNSTVTTLPRYVS